MFVSARVWLAPFLLRTICCNQASKISILSITITDLTDGI
ncbi:hypothetical protein BBB_1104 [Bifidobacterium bifidum BGN4]|uniref:Uncharacterized protein n=1 Tax=Bifidobacterium bifidum BGN4 TaxID=484020 RepID=I3WII3_BIFBI|nr:hypothetical protein BBB_1104 [Bifidobacterium bifidum BGN4]